MEVAMPGPKPQFQRQKVCSFSDAQADAIEAAAQDLYEGNSSAMIRAAVTEWLIERRYLKKSRSARSAKPS
jgi:hypothetical protein